MRPGARLRALAAALLLLCGCAAHREGKLPTLEDYSDGTSAYADALLAAWKSDTFPPVLFASPLSWSGPLPGDGLRTVATRPQLSAAVYRASETPIAASTADLAGRLTVLRARFSTLGR